MAWSSSSESLPEPACSRAPRTCLDLLTIPCSHRYAQYARGSTLFAFATPFPRPGSWRWSDARICTTSRGDHASRSRVSLVGGLHVRGRRLGKHLRWSWAGPVARPCHSNVWERKAKVSSTTVARYGFIMVCNVVFHPSASESDTPFVPVDMVTHNGWA